MAITLPALPYEQNDLEPHISANTLSFHYGKHHNAYVVNLNKLIVGSELAGEDLESIILETYDDSKRQGIFNNAAQIWNHTFYWNSMSRSGGGSPKTDIGAKIVEDFGGFEEFKTELTNAALTQFGSGWAWLVLTKEGKLKITKTANAETPLTSEDTPLLTIDVWEHAYYLDYQNLRPSYVKTFLEHLVNWDFANENLLAAQKKNAA